MLSRDSMPDLPRESQRTVSLEDLDAYAAALWRQLSPGSVVWLTGELGAGKTAFVQAVARAAGAEPARSPTFALVHEYPAEEGLLVHVDCYRLRSPEEAIDIDFPELVRQARLILVEWPERAGPLVPAADAHFAFAHTEVASQRIISRVC